MANFLQNMPLLPTGGCCRIGRDYRLTRRYTGCVLARKANGCPACRMHTGALRHRETSGWTRPVGQSPAGGGCRMGGDYRSTRRYTGCVLARKVNGCRACRLQTGVLSHRETSGWTALVGDSPAGCQVRPTADAVAATGTAALFDHRVLLLVAKCGFKRPAPLVVPAFFVGTSDTWLSTKVFSLIKMGLLAGRI